MVFWSAKERLRRQAARWFGRMHGSSAFRYNRQFKAWLDKDLRHRETYQRLVLLWDASYALKPSEGDANADGDLGAPASEVQERPWKGPALAAAVLAVAALGAGLIFSVQNRPAETVLVSMIGQRKTLALADGTRLILDADSAVSPQITSHVRTVRLLRGRARFTVAAASAPFRVLAGDTVVTAHGTKFDVDRLTADRLNITLIQGTVDIVRRHGFSLLSASRPIRLSGRQSLSLSGVRSAVFQTPSSLGGADWTLEPLSFDQTPLGDALIEANRYSARKIRLGSPDLGRLKITAVFDTGAPMALAPGLARALGLSLDLAPNGDLVLSRHAA